MNQINIILKWDVFRQCWMFYAEPWERLGFWSQLLVHGHAVNRLAPDISIRMGIKRWLDTWAYWELKGSNKNPFNNPDSINVTIDRNNVYAIPSAFWPNAKRVWI